MIRYVVDASCLGPLLLKDEADLLIEQVSEGLALGECVVPTHWRFEVANMVLVALRRKRLSPAHARAGLAQIERFAVSIDADSLDAAFNRTFELASAHGLTLYDAAYLELAQRLRLILLSTDNDLVRAARNDGVEVVNK